MTAAALLALSDDELAIYLNGGYGVQKRNQAMATVRSALQSRATQDKAVEATYNASATLPHLPERASEQGGQG